jgi:hypothetical protein
MELSERMLDTQVTMDVDALSGMYAIPGSLLEPVEGDCTEFLMFRELFGQKAALLLSAAYEMSNAECFTCATNMMRMFLDEASDPKDVPRGAIEDKQTRVMTIKSARKKLKEIEKVPDSENGCAGGRKAILMNESIREALKLIIPNVEKGSAAITTVRGDVTKVDNLNPMSMYSIRPHDPVEYILCNCCTVQLTVMDKSGVVKKREIPDTNGEIKISLKGWAESGKIKCEIVKTSANKQETSESESEPVREETVSEPVQLPPPVSLPPTHVQPLFNKISLVSRFRIPIGCVFALLTLLTLYLAVKHGVAAALR